MKIAFIYASSSGHTEHVVEHIVRSIALSDRDVDCQVIRAPHATPEDLLAYDMVVLASGTWLVDMVEGELHALMKRFLAQCDAIDFEGAAVGVIGLGDDRYRYQCKAVDHLQAFVESHGGRMVPEALRIMGEPYGQEEKIEEWAAELLLQMPRYA